MAILYFIDLVQFLLSMNICRLLSDDNSSKSQCTAANYRHLQLGSLASWSTWSASNSSTISDSDDEEIAKEALEEGVDEAAHENGIKGYQDDFVYIFIFVV